MKNATVQCSNCLKKVLFSQDPYKTPGATKYWISTYKETENSLLVVERNTPSQNKKGKITMRKTKEYIIAAFCSASCGVEYGNRKKVSN